MTIVFMFAGALLMYLFLRRYYNKSWDKKLGVEVRLSKSEAVCGDKVDLIETVTNQKRLPIPILEVKFQVDKELEYLDQNDNHKVTDRNYRDDIFSLLSYQRITRTIPMTCTKRGFYKVDNLQLVSTGIFMNDVCVTQLPVNSSIIVYPKQIDASELDAYVAAIFGQSERASRLNPDPFAFRAVRDYRQDDPFNSINWKASAKSNQLMVNEYNDSLTKSVRIILNVNPRGQLLNERVTEYSISIASTLSRIFIDQGYDLEFLTNAATNNSQSAYFSPMQGKTQLDAINTYLARVDLKKPSIDCSAFLADQLKELDKSAICPMTIIISEDCRSGLQDRIEEITTNSFKNIWILPSLSDEEVSDIYIHADLIPWRVKKI